MLKKIIYPILFLLFLTSCEINPLLGVGSTVDTLAPQVVSVIPTDNSYIRDDFDFIATFYDNLLVTEAKLEIERNGEKIFEKSEKIDKEKTGGNQLWRLPISLEKDLNIYSNKQDNEFKMTVYAYDAKGNISEKSYKSVTIVVDLDNAGADVYLPKTFKESKIKNLRDSDVNSENFTVFQNSTFQIKGECEDNSNSIQSVILTLKDENNESVQTLKLEDLFAQNLSCIDGSLFHWDLTFFTGKTRDSSFIPLNISSVTDTYFYEIFLQVKDTAGNLTFTNKNGHDDVLGKSFGWFAVRQVADYPFSDFSSINDKVSANSILTGKSYDDDGIKRINIYRKTVDIEEWELIKSYSSDGEDADDTLNGMPKTFTWTIPSPQTSTSTEYQLKVEVVDIYDNSSLEGYEEERISENKVFCSFGLVDPAAPTVEPIDLTDFKGVVDENGDFTINVKASDNSAVNKIYLAWKPENLEEKPQWSILDSQENKVYTAENGIKYWNISPETLEKEANQSLTLNVYDDFDNHYDKKSFYIYVEDDSGKHTQTEASMPRFTELPDVKFTSPNSAAVETTYNNQTFNIIFEISSFIKKLKTVEVSGFNADEKHSVSLDGITPIYDAESNSWKYECTISSSEWWKSGEGNGSYSLVVEVKDVFDNVNTDMLSFEIDNGVPKIKSVSAETEPGSYCAGSEIEILLEMKKDVFVDATKENLTLILNNGGIAYYNPQKGRTIKTRKLYFTYKIEETDESVALDAISLELNGAKIYDDVGNIDGLGDVTGTSLTESIKIDSAISIEKNSSSMLIIDNIPPKVTTVTSVTPNGSYTVDDVINLIVEFDEEINVSGNPTLTLSNDQIANFDKLENHKQLYFNYKVENAVNIDKLEWKSLNAGVGGVIKDCAVNNKDAYMSGNKVDFSTLVYSSDVSLVKSGQIFRIDNQNPVYENSTSKYNTDGSLSFTINFDEPVYKVSGKKAVLMREAHAVPVVLSVDKYNEYVALVPGIADYYEEGVNGASSSFKIDNTTKYVLKYEYDETHSELLELFQKETLGYYKQEIMMESNWVESKDNSIIITIPKENLLTGEFYTLTVEDGFAEDQVGLPYEDDFATSGKIQAGTKAQPPVIRIKKITGGNAQITVMKINTITKDASIKYNTNGSSTLDADYAIEVELGSANYTNATYKIKAQAQIVSGTASDYGYEVAYKTVIYTSHEVKTSGDEVYFRGSNVESGTATVPNFPFSWDEASSPLLWADRGTAADVGMIKATLSNKRYYVVSWGVTDTLYFRPLSCKKETETGRLIWAWGQGGSAKVSPGRISDSNIHATAGAYEKNYHDRFGNNY
ncbi:MAG: hypothetical protein UHW86_07420 [Spirochaetota bacterium]|nr:hypothetical protein [Spirochaetota bacterium]